MVIALLPLLPLVACGPSGPSLDELTTSWEAGLARHAIGTWERPPIVSGAAAGDWGPALAAVDPKAELSTLLAETPDSAVVPLGAEQLAALASIAPPIVRGAASSVGRSPYALGAEALREDPMARRPLVASQAAHLVGRTILQRSLARAAPDREGIDLMAAALQLTQDQARGATLLVSMLATANLELLSADLRATLRLPGWSAEGLGRLAGHLTALVSAPPRFADVVETEGLAIQAAFVAAHRGPSWAPPAGANDGPAGALGTSEGGADVLRGMWMLHSNHVSRLRGAAAAAPPGGMVEAIARTEKAAGFAAGQTSSPVAAFYQRLKLVGHAERWVCARQHLAVAAAETWLRAERARTGTMPDELPSGLALDPVSGDDFAYRVEAGAAHLTPAPCASAENTAPALTLTMP